MKTRTLSLSLPALLALSLAAQERTIRLPRNPQISPDGQQVAFAWRGDLWIASCNGPAAKTGPASASRARRLTTHPADDSSPFWHPDQKTLAFVSQRDGGSQIWTVPTAGGTPTQITQDSHRKQLLGYGRPGGGELQLLVGISTDRSFHYSESTRLYAVDPTGEQPKRMLLDVGLREAALSPDGKHLLFVRGRPMWSRKGYSGSQAAQLWHADMTSDKVQLTRLDRDRPDFQNVAEHWPIWSPDNDQSYYFVSDPDGTANVYRRQLGASEAQQITDVGQADRSDDGVAFPSMSRDGKRMLLRRRFDLLLVDTASGKTQPIALAASGDDHSVRYERRTISAATDVAFASDGKQMAFVAGEDIWVMDRVLKEPRRVTNTPHAETSPCFSADGSKLFYVSDAAGEADIWSASHGRDDGIWWLADDFAHQQVTDDRDVEGRLIPSPKGGHIAYLKGTDIFVMDDDGSDHRRIVDLWSRPDVSWSPDGAWLAYATQDSDYNSDVFVVPLDGTREPFNISRHPDYDGSPAWSGDGKRLAFVSRRDGEESDIYYVNLSRDVEEQTSRDRKLEEAIAAMKKGKKANKSGGGPGKSKAVAEAAAKKSGKESSTADAANKVTIDFDGIADRRHRISIRDSREGSLIWSPDGNKLLFTATVDAKRGLFAVDFPKLGKPKRVADAALQSAQWLRGSNEIVGRQGGTPAVLKGGSKLETFAFSVRQTRDWSAVRQISFDQGWRAMRDRFYDPAMNNRDWQAIRRKYRPVAAQCLGAREFSELMNMMLGELNASHMGHRGGRDALPRIERDSAWTPRTMHLGLRFANRRGKQGLVVTSVIPNGPCAASRSRVEAGETVLAVDGTSITANVDLDTLLTMPEARDVELRVLGADGAERSVTVRPVASVAGLLYDEWVEQNRRKVDEQSGGKLGYLHIRGMNMSSFRQMEEDLYHAGAGKDGLIVDVRFNGGGSTTDHVLTALTQPVHAITKSRGSGEGYPQDRKIYASWSKPIVLMCNEHSFSNAEILAHAIKQLGRGRVVGMRTAGGVISTGGVSLLDQSTVRMPMRGWYLAATGEDMELNGCLPDLSMWNDPMGSDRQLAQAVTALAEDVDKLERQGRVQIVPAATKRRQTRAADAAANGGGR
ncbi:MAG: S41 family peptidase [Planctomycetota bacterium]